jgi:hypothetical protein
MMRFCILALALSLVLAVNAHAHNKELDKRLSGLHQKLMQKPLAEALVPSQDERASATSKVKAMSYLPHMFCQMLPQCDDVDASGHITIPEVYNPTPTERYYGFGEHVEHIPQECYRECRGLKSVTIPNSITSIGPGAFSGCTGLTSVTIPDSVETIGPGAFSGCTGLTSVTIPDSVETISRGAFSGCTGLTSVTIPGSVTSIDDFAFTRCTGLTSVTIPNSVTTIGPGAFFVCTGLTSVTIPDSVETISRDAFTGCTGLTSVTIPDSVETIDDSAFARISLHYVAIPASVMTIGHEAFESANTYCFLGSPPTSLASNAFGDAVLACPPPPSPPPPISCECNTPSRGTDGSNSYKCDDGFVGSCSSTQECFAISTFIKGQWGDACRVPRAPICTCESPSSGTAGHNSFHCEDGYRGSCAGSETCYATSAFYKEDWSTGCRAPQFCFCDHPGSTTGSNGYYCEDGHGYLPRPRTLFEEIPHSILLVSPAC